MRASGPLAKIDAISGREEGNLAMNDYMESPEGNRVRWLRPVELQRRSEVMHGQTRLPGVAYIDQWLPPDPPDAA